MERRNLWEFNSLGILIPTSLPIPATDDQLLAIYSFSMELAYIGKASSNRWSQDQLTRLNMSEWQQQVTKYLTYGDYLLMYRIPPYTTSIQLYSMGIISVPLILQPILITPKGQGILIFVITLHEKHFPMESFACNTAGLMIWLPTYSPNFYQLG